MGILNVTPKSRYGSDCYQQIDTAVNQALNMVAEGAAIIDIGGESTRPGAENVSIEEEIKRVLPVLTALRPKTSAIISIDTRKPEVMRAVISAGADMINDVNALQAPAALKIIADSTVGVCLMHMQGDPQTMQQNPSYQNVVQEVGEFLQQRLKICLAAGINPDRIVLDPGFGFGKTLQHNLQLLKCLRQLTVLGRPVLVGLSRKSMLEKLLGLAVEQRLPASLALAVIATQHGAKIIRTHDVRATWEAIQTTSAVLEI